MRLVLLVVLVIGLIAVETPYTLSLALISQQSIEDKVIHVYPGMSIQEAIDNASPGTTIVLHPTYYCESVVIDGKYNLTITIAYWEGNVYWYGNSADPIITVVNSHNIVIDGVNPQYLRIGSGMQYWRVIRIIDSENIVIRGIWVEGRGTRYLKNIVINITCSNNIVIENCIIGKNSIYSTTVATDTNNITIANNKIYVPVKIMGRINNVLVINNIFKGHGVILYKYIDNVLIENNSFLGIDKNAVKLLLLNSSNIVIRGNYFNKTGSNYIYDMKPAILLKIYEDNRDTNVSNIHIGFNKIYHYDYIVKIVTGSPSGYRYRYIHVCRLVIYGNYINAEGGWYPGLLGIFIGSLTKTIFKDLYVVGNHEYREDDMFSNSYYKPIYVGIYGLGRAIIDGMQFYGNILDDIDVVPNKYLFIKLKNVYFYSPFTVDYSYLGYNYTGHIGNYFRYWDWRYGLVDSDGDGVAEDTISYGVWYDPYPLYPRDPVYMIDYIDRDKIIVKACAERIVYSFGNITDTRYVPVYRIYSPPSIGVDYIDTGYYTLKINVYALENNGVRTVSSSPIETLVLDTVYGWINGSLSHGDTVYVYTDWYYPAKVYVDGLIYNDWIYRYNVSILCIKGVEEYSVKLARIDLDLHVNGTYYTLDNHSITVEINGSYPSNYTYMLVGVNSSILYNGTVVNKTITWNPIVSGYYRVYVEVSSRYKILGRLYGEILVKIDPRPTSVHVYYKGLNVTNSTITTYALEKIDLTAIVRSSIGDVDYGYIVVLVNNSLYYNMSLSSGGYGDIVVGVNGSGIYCVEVIYSGLRVYSDSYAYIYIVALKRPLYIVVEDAVYSMSNKTLYLRLRFIDAQRNTSLLATIPVNIRVYHPGKGYIDLGSYGVRDYLEIIRGIDPVYATIYVDNNPYYTSLIENISIRVIGWKNSGAIYPTPEYPLEPLILLTSLLILLMTRIFLRR